MTPEDIIDNKCDAVGCDDKRRAKHLKLFVYEHWDCHPEPDFVAWWAKHPQAANCNKYTAWNTNRNRQEYLRWQQGIPEPQEELSQEALDLGKRFMAALFAWRDKRAQS